MTLLLVLALLVGPIVAFHYVDYWVGYLFKTDWDAIFGRTAKLQEIERGERPRHRLLWWAHLYRIGRLRPRLARRCTCSNGPGCLRHATLLDYQMRPDRGYIKKLERETAA